MRLDYIKTVIEHRTDVSNATDTGVKVCEYKQMQNSYLHNLLGIREG